MKNIPMNKACVWNIDTGAAFKGKLTIMDIETKEFGKVMLYLNCILMKKRKKLKLYLCMNNKKSRKL